MIKPASGERQSLAYQLFGTFGNAVVFWGLNLGALCCVVLLLFFGGAGQSWAVLAICAVIQGVNIAVTIWGEPRFDRDPSRPPAGTAAAEAARLARVQNSQRDRRSDRDGR